MSISVSKSLTIDRDHSEIVAIMFNPKKDTLWIRGLSNVYPMNSGLYSKGDNIERVGKFLKKSYSAKVVVTNVKEGEMVELYSDEPFEMRIKYEIKPEEGGTRVKYSIASIADVPFETPPKVLNKMVEDMVAEDLARLKAFAEKQ